MTRAEREIYLRGRHEFEHGDHEAALTRLTDLLATRDDFADVHYLVGLIRERRGELGDAARHLERALQLNPAYVEAQLALSSVLEQRGEFERSGRLAERQAEVALPRDGGLDATTRAKLANLQAAVADAYREVGEHREAIQAYRKALEYGPRFHDLRLRLAMTLRDAGLPHQALVELRRILRAKPDDAGALVQLGLTLYTLGRSDGALEQWRAVLAREPEREDARMYVRLVESAREAREG
jgi:tetratricopeptide (TPR) repeat protein